MNAINHMLRIVGLLCWVLIMANGCNPKQRIGDLELRDVFTDADVRKLASAAAKGNTRDIDRMASDGVDLNAFGRRGITPLWWAAWAGSADGVQHLLQKGAAPNVQPSDAPSSMEVAARNPRPQILQALLASGGDTDLRSKNSFGYTPLHGANIGKSVECTKLLIEAKADLEVRDNAGWTPFLQACILFNYDQAILLLEAGADYTITINAHDRPLTVWTELRRGGERLRESSAEDIARRRLISLLEERESKRKK